MKVPVGVNVSLAVRWMRWNDAVNHAVPLRRSGVPLPHDALLIGCRIGLAGLLRFKSRWTVASYSAGHSSRA